MQEEPNWIRYEEFIALADWLCGGKAPERTWAGMFSSAAITKIAKEYEVYIGIQGGEAALEKMSIQEVSRKRWAVSMKKKTSQWLPAHRYLELLRKIQSGETGRPEAANLRTSTVNK